MGKYESNKDWIRQFTDGNDDLDAIMEGAGHKVLTAAEGLSQEFRKTGDWESHLSGHLDHADGYPYYRVEDDRIAATYIEFGTSKTPAHRALGRAINSAEI